jgi:hypothetical protein
VVVGSMKPSCHRDQHWPARTAKGIQLHNKSEHSRLKYRTTESSNRSTYQKIMILFEERRKGCAKFFNVCFDVTCSANDLHKFLSVRSKSHGNLPPNCMSKSPKQGAR